MSRFFSLVEEASLKLLQDILFQDTANNGIHPKMAYALLAGTKKHWSL